MDSNLTENIIDDFETHKLCDVCNKVRKFRVINHKTKGKILSGRKCLKCFYYYVEKEGESHLYILNKKCKFAIS